MVTSQDHAHHRLAALWVGSSAGGGPKSRGQAPFRFRRLSSGRTVLHHGAAAGSVTRSRALAVAVLIGASLSSNAFAMGRHDAPCDGFMDCIYTAYWYAFLR